MIVGNRSDRIQFKRGTKSKDDHGGAVITWVNYVEAYAQVIYGTGQERREAAQEAASQPATFRVPANSRTRALTVQDKIAGFLGTDWDITSVVPLGRDGMEITAVRSAP